jgi:acyl-CoA thioesterase
MELRDTHMNGLNSTHGGALFTLADFAFALACNSHGSVAVAINANISFLKGSATGWLRAEAREITKNHRLGTYTVEIKDEKDELIALFQGMAYRKPDQKISDIAAKEKK